MTDAELMDTFGVRYTEPNESRTFDVRPGNLYWYRCYAGRHTSIEVAAGDAAWWLDPTTRTAFVRGGPFVLATSPAFAVVMRGYMPEEQRSTFARRTTLPYVNGCSTKQIFPPNRPGDPTLQFLDIPPHSSEQAHHIHSTVRCVYVLEGSGTSVVGMNKATVKTALKPGMVCVLEPMCPHHFETDDDHCVVVPFHVWSTVPGAESMHPMFSGTHMMNQGE